MKYIAYGSNMVKEQMARRCPDAKFIGAGYINGAQLEFYLHATVEYSRIEGTRVPVAVWEISNADEHRLDRYEGYPSFYTKQEVFVRMNDGSKIKGMIYLMNLIRTAPPTDVYYEGIADAYKALGFNSEITTVLEPAYQRSLMRSA